MMKTHAAFAALALVSAEWEDFKMTYGKYYNGPEAEAEHKAAYLVNMLIVAEQNAKDESLKLGENQFADLMLEEFRTLGFLGYRNSSTEVGQVDLGVHVYNGEALAASVDWTTQGAVTPVKQQGGCGSCWAFSAVGSIESAWQIASGHLTSMSEQQLIDCSADGCSGSTPKIGIVAESSLNVCTEGSYPYRAIQSSCKSQCDVAMPRGSITGFWHLAVIGIPSVNDLKSAIQKQPVSVGIEAGSGTFKFYKSGVISSDCGNANINHAVVAVGYGTSTYQNSQGITISEDYWFIKNSWSRSWGQDGYVKISQNNNTCGVLNQPVYPEVSLSVAV